VFIEPVWVFRKGNSEYPKTEKNTLDSFFAWHNSVTVIA
jgi:hypothetical protein